MCARAVEEPIGAALAAQSARLLRRAGRRPGKVLGGAAVIVMAALVVTARRPVRQVATAVLRMTEDGRAPAPMRMPWSDRALRGYVNEVAFSHTQLLTLIEHHHMFRGDGAFDPILAVETFRERIEVEVVQNHAIALIDRGNRPRSAHVKISYADGDPERALMVARALGELVVATGANQQHAQAEVALRLAEAAATGAQTTLERLRLRAISFARPPYQARSPADLPGLREALRVAQDRGDHAREARESAERHLRDDGDRGGLEIELVETLAVPAPWPVWRRLLVVGSSAALLCLPLAALVVGAWDRRIYDPADLAHLGARCLGHLPRTQSSARRREGLTKEET